MELFCHKNKEILPLVTIWMDLEGIMLSEMTGQREKDKHGLLICDQREKDKHGLLICDQTHRYRSDLWLPEDLGNWMKAVIWYKLPFYKL